MQSILHEPAELIRTLARAVLAVGVLSLLVAAIPASAAARPRGPIDLAGGWQFRLDPNDTGLQQGWQRPGAPFASERTMRTGESLADQGVPGYKGWSWFRRTITVPDGWRRVLLGFGAVDVAAQLYVNGDLAGEFDDAHLGAKAALVDLSERAQPGQPLTLAFRVRGEGGFGGIKQEVRLGTDEAQVMTGQQYGIWLHEAHPDWRLLPWMAGGRRAWTVVGQEGGAARAILAGDGSFSPWAGGWSASFWLYGRTSRQLVAFGPPKAELVEGSLPLPVLTFETGPWRLREELLPAGDAAHPGVEARLTLLAAPEPADLYVAARPYTASGGMSPIRQAALAGDSLRLNGQPALRLETAPAYDSTEAPAAGGGLASSSATTAASRPAPARGAGSPQADASGTAGTGPTAGASGTAGTGPTAGASGTAGTGPAGANGTAGTGPATGVTGGAIADGDVSALAAAIPRAATAESADGHAQALLRAPIEPGKAAILLAPSVAGEPIPAAVEPAHVAEQWRGRLHRVELELPDARLRDAFYASLGYILESERRGQIHPGPLLHDAFWVRDAAMIGYALERAGLADAVRGSAEAVLGAITPGGQVHAITNPDGRPRADLEWDAPGEAAFALAEYARWSGDAGFLARAYPAMQAALTHALDARDASGLLPANESAEDLGASSQHHYWDDFWLLAGLAEAQDAAGQLGDAAGARQLAGEADQLRASLLASIQASGSDVIPNGPEDLTSSAMARGTTPAIWPLAVLPGETPLLRRSFEAYRQRFMPDGAFRHLYGQWWPYGGLEVAHALLLLGDGDAAQQTLTYTLDHQTFPGLYAWAEGVDPASGDFAEGDMPHAWASAELVNLVRDMLLVEDGDKLVIGEGVPAAWAGQPFAIRNAPTRWGAADVSVAASGQVRVSGVQPPGGVELRLPFPATLAS